MSLLKTLARFRASLILAGSIAAVVPASAEQQMEDIMLEDIRGMRYCEILLILDHGVDIYNTSANDGCPDDKWQAMDTDAIAAAHGAKEARLNGPKFWAPDAQTVKFGETKTFGGIDARYAATLPLSALGAEEGVDAYTGFTSSKKQTLIFKAGLPVYELVDAEGNAYALNAYGDAVQGGDPATLADQISLAEGWSFRVTTPDEDLIVAPPTDGPTQMVGDDMRQYYTRIDAGAN